MPTHAHIAMQGRRLRGRIRETTRDMLRGVVPRGSAISLAQTDVPLDAAHFDVAICRTCGCERQAPHCGACGQNVWRGSRWAT